MKNIFKIEKHSTIHTIWMKFINQIWPLVLVFFFFSWFPSFLRFGLNFQNSHAYEHMLTCLISLIGAKKTLQCFVISDKLEESKTLVSIRSH
jgi:hypothetical protein